MYNLDFSLGKIIFFLTISISKIGVQVCEKLCKEIVNILILYKLFLEKGLETKGKSEGGVNVDIDYFLNLKTC